MVVKGFSKKKKYLWFHCIILSQFSRPLEHGKAKKAFPDV